MSHFLQSDAAGSAPAPPAGQSGRDGRVVEMRKEHARTNTRTRSHAHTLTRSHALTRTRSQAHAHTCTPAHRHTRTHAHPHTHTHAHTHTHLQLPPARPSSQPALRRAASACLRGADRTAAAAREGPRGGKRAVRLGYIRTATSPETHRETHLCCGTFTQRCAQNPYTAAVINGNHICSNKDRKRI